MTRIFPTLLNLGVLALFLLTSPAQAGTWKSIASWDIQYNDKSCFTLDTYGNGTLFGFGLTTRGEFDLLISNAAWNLGQGEGEGMAQVKVDDADWSRHAVRTLNGQTILISLAPEPESVRVLQVGSTVRIRLGEAEFSYALVGTKLMLPELLKCALAVSKTGFL